MIILMITLISTFAIVESTLYYRHCRKGPFFDIPEKIEGFNVNLPTKYSMKPTTDNTGLLKYCVLIKKGFKTESILFNTEMKAISFVRRNTL